MENDGEDEKKKEGAVLYCMYKGDRNRKLSTSRAPHENQAFSVILNVRPTDRPTQCQCYLTLILLKSNVLNAIC